MSGDFMPHAVGPGQRTAGSSLPLVLLPRLSRPQRLGSWVLGTVVWRQPLPSHPPSPFWGFPAPRMALCCAPAYGLRSGVSDRCSQSQGALVSAFPPRSLRAPCTLRKRAFSGRKSVPFCLAETSRFSTSEGGLRMQKSGGGSPASTCLRGMFPAHFLLTVSSPTPTSFPIPRATPTSPLPDSSVSRSCAPRSPPAVLGAAGSPGPRVAPSQLSRGSSCVRHLKPGMFSWLVLGLSSAPPTGAGRSSPGWGDTGPTTEGAGRGGTTWKEHRISSRSAAP